MPKKIQIENKSEVKIGGLHLRNATGNAIRVTYDGKKAVLDVVQCCIGETAQMPHES
ncbi:MAG: hypothetical protein JRN06_00035 [Nitrososphaerota archaeon]|nr:hypothetical protein [Nitrososphaerota archaeon]MDG7023760.1 hypothetical protein [Nitrososphaerota archaeon]